MKTRAKHIYQQISVHIRRAKLPDATIVTRFNAAMGRETEGVILEERRLRSGVKAILGDPTKGFYLVAEVSGKVVGQMMVTQEWSDWRNGFFWWIQSVYVHRLYRGLGVYGALHKHVVKLGKKRKDICGIRLYVDRHNRRAKKVYKKFGMKKSNYEMFEEDFVLDR